MTATRRCPWRELARPGWALALAVAACGGGPVHPAGPAARSPVHLVRCRPAPPLPALGGSGAVFGSLMGSLVGELEPALSGANGAPPPPPPSIRVAIGAPVVTGALEPVAVARVLQRRQGELAACAAKTTQLLASGPASSKAVVTWRFTIGPGGKVIQLAAAAQVLSPELAGCVTGVIERTTFSAPPAGGVAAVTLPIAFDATGAAVVAPPPEADPVPPWTPYASDSSEPSEAAVRIARAVEGALRGKLGAIDACFSASPVTGSLRALLTLDADGHLSAARAGGLGERAIEACVENAVSDLTAVTPVRELAEIACDLARGDAQPWRVTADRSGYGVIEVARTRVRHGDQLLAVGEEPDSLTEHSTYLIIADADAPGGLVGLAMQWARDADATLVAVRPAAPAGAPARFLAMGQTTASAAASDEDPARATLELGAGALTACTGRWRRAARIADPVAVGAAAQELATRCRAQRCSPALVIALDRDAVARDLVEVAGAARRAGFERMLVVRGGGGKPAEDEELDPGISCTPPNAGDGE